MGYKEVPNLRLNPGSVVTINDEVNFFLHCCMTLRLPHIAGTDYIFNPYLGLLKYGQPSLTHHQVKIQS